LIGIATSIKKFFTLKKLAMIVIAIVVSTSVGVGGFLSLKRDVAVNEGGKVTEFVTMKTTVGEALNERGISIGAYDYISVSPNTELQKSRKTEINIKRAVPINVFVGKETKKLYTYRGNVKDALAYSTIEYSGKDRLDGAKPSDKIVSDMSFRVIDVTEKIVQERVAVPYTTISRGNNRLDRGKKILIRAGKIGRREKRYKIVYEDGKRVKKSVISNKLLVAPINKIVEKGTVARFKTSRGAIVRYSRVLYMTATSYTASYQDTGKSPGDYGFGITATGVRVREGIVAVDPRVIPLGSRLYIEGVGNSPSYGYAVAADTGGAIKGNIIDVYYGSTSESIQWGRRYVKVYVLTN